MRQRQAYLNKHAKPAFGSVRINWAHPLARGLIGCWLFNEGGGQPLDLVAGAPTTKNGSPAWGVSDLGTARSFSGHPDYDQVAHRNVYDVTTVSIVGVVRSTNATGNQFIACRGFGGTYVPYGLSIGASAANRAGMVFYNGGWRQSGVTTDVRGDNKDHVISGTWDGTTLRYFIDGALNASAAPGVAPGSDATDFYLGDWVLDGEGFKGLIYSVSLYGIALSDAHILALSAEPYAFLTPKAPRVRYRNLAAAAASRPVPSLMLTGVGT